LPVAATAEQYETALEWLEQGCSIVWNQLLSLRTPVDALRDVDRTLADALLHTSIALERASYGNSGMQDISAQSDRQLSMEQVAQHHRRLAEEWEALVDRVRAIAGFENFLQPKKFAQLCSAAKAGPVVVINIHEFRCDALVLVDGLDEVVHISLDDFSYEQAQRLHRSLSQLLLTAGVRTRDTRAMRRITTTTGAGFPSVLSDLWSHIVKPVLDSLVFTVSPVQLFVLHSRLINVLQGILQNGPSSHLVVCHRAPGVSPNTRSRNIQHK
jgi:hypothetical protein